MNLLKRSIVFIFAVGVIGNAYCPSDALFDCISRSVRSWAPGVAQRDSQLENPYRHYCLKEAEYARFEPLKQANKNFLCQVWLDNCLRILSRVYSETRELYRMRDEQRVHLSALRDVVFKGEAASLVGRTPLSLAELAEEEAAVKRVLDRVLTEEFEKLRMASSHIFTGGFFPVSEELPLARKDFLCGVDLVAVFALLDPKQPKLSLVLGDDFVLRKIEQDGTICDIFGPDGNILKRSKDLAVSDGGLRRRVPAPAQTPVVFPVAAPVTDEDDRDGEVSSARPCPCSIL